jgi:hypothetical protein
MTDRRNITILGMGASVVDYLNMNMDMTGSGPLSDEVWAINLMGAIVQCDRVIMMDHPEEWDVAFGQPVLDRLAKAPAVYTAIFEDDEKPWPNVVPYPIRDVLAAMKFPYLNNSVAYAVALAITEERKRATDTGQPYRMHLRMLGCDFGYDDPSQANIREAGRACTEFWLSQHMACGGTVTLSPRSNLLGGNSGFVLYGYECTAQELGMDAGVKRLVVTQSQPEPAPDETDNVVPIHHKTAAE